MTQIPVTTSPCELCSSATADEIFKGKKLRVVLVDDAAYPGFCRVIWQEHIKEMTDLNDDDRNLFMEVVWQVEAGIREVMQPDKVNLASLGNSVPHLHWHVIPRYVDDAHFPSPIWGVIKREPSGLAARIALLPRLRKVIFERLAFSKAAA